MPPILQHIEFAEQKGWLPYYEEAAAWYGIPVELLLAKDSRESMLGSMPGLIERGWIGSDGVSTGISQINAEEFAFARQTDPNDVRAYVAKGAEILKAEMQRFPGNMKAALAAYNAGAGNVRRALDAGRDPDSVTTKGNYAADVLNRAAQIGGVTVSQQIKQAVTATAAWWLPAAAIGGLILGRRYGLFN